MVSDEKVDKIAVVVNNSGNRTHNPREWCLATCQAASSVSTYIYHWTLIPACKTAAKPVPMPLNSSSSTISSSSGFQWMVELSTGGPWSSCPSLPTSSYGNKDSCHASWTTNSAASCNCAVVLHAASIPGWRILMLSKFLALT
jgi:hypothetical protein